MAVLYPSSSVLMYSKLTKRIAALMTIAALALSAFAMLVPITHAQASCTFTKDLSLGATGEDVRCLQKYLNAKGYTIATSGVGSPGQETNQFQAKTQAALIKWQTANGISPATGTFGPKSREKYKALMGGSTTTSTPSPAIPSSNSAVTIEARVAILAAISAYEDAVDEGGNKGDIEDAANLLHDAFIAFLNGNLSQAKTLASSAEDKADEAMGNDDEDEDEDEDEDDNDDADEGDAEDALDELEDAINDAEDAIDDAEDDSSASEKKINGARDTLDDAEELFDEAQDAFDDEDWDEVMDLVDEAQNEIDDVYEWIGEERGGDEDEADEALEELEDALDDAWDELDESDASNSRKDSAEELLDEADDLLDDAEDAFDDEDWDEVVDLVDDALDLIEEALDELD